MLSREWPDKAVTTVNLTNKASTDMTSMMQESMVCTQCCDAWYQPELMQVSFSWGIPRFLMLYKNHKPTAENITLLYTCACLTWLESTLLESMETAVDEDSLSTAQKKEKRGLNRPRAGSPESRIELSMLHPLLQRDWSPFWFVLICSAARGIDATSSPAETVITILVCVDLLCSKRDT